MHVTLADSIASYLVIGTLIAGYLTYVTVTYPGGIDEHMDEEKQFMIDSPCWASLLHATMILFWLPAMLMRFFHD